MKKLLAIIFLAFFSMIVSTAEAGGPFMVANDDSGIPLKWQDSRLNWYLDPGNVSPNGSNALGAEWLDEVFFLLTNNMKLYDSLGHQVVTSDFTHAKIGTLDRDVNLGNYEEYKKLSAGPTAIIFDETGEIIADIFGEANADHIVGVSAPTLSDSTNRFIVRGIAIFNGNAIEKGIFGSKQEVFVPLFKATMLHEIGHLINLDHAQVNDDVAQECGEGGSISEREGLCGQLGHVIPTMYPELFTITQSAFKMDDIISLSSVYPTTAFQNEFCTITGKIYDSRGKYLKGVNVVASRADGSELQGMMDARSFISGAMTGNLGAIERTMRQGCSGDSSYYLKGIVPGRKYKVVAEPLNRKYSGESGFEPLSSPPRRFERQPITDSAGNETVSCANGGETIVMASLAIDVRNPCDDAGSDVDGSALTAGEGLDASSSKSCTFVQGGASTADILPYILMIMALIPIALVRKRI